MSDASRQGGIAVLQDFEKLEGRENYNDWKFLMKMFLIHENLWRCIEGYPKGDMTPEETRSRRDMIALSSICLMVKPCALAHVRSARTAEEAWNNLEKIYADQGTTTRIMLLRSFCSAKLENFDSMEKYVSEVITVAQRLAAMGKPMDDELIGAMLLQGLPAEFDPMIMALEDNGNKLTSDFVKCKLMQDVRWSKNKAGDAVLVTESNKYSAKANRKTSTSWTSGVEGHARPQCPNGKTSEVLEAAAKKQIKASYSTPASQYREDVHTQELQVAGQESPFERMLYKGFEPGSSLDISVHFPNDLDRVSFNLVSYPTTSKERMEIGEGDDVVLHFDVRLRGAEIVRNTFRSGSWGEEERVGGIPMEAGSDYSLKFVCERQGYRIFINDIEYTFYRHRIPPKNITHLVIQGVVTLNNVTYKTTPASQYVELSRRNSVIRRLRILFENRMRATRI